MKLIAPDYYSSFYCIADKCNHSCCKGWEIDIDSETLALYQQFSGEWGDKLRQNIDLDAETPCFRLKEDERCPFLQKDGLCELILNLGEGMLCQICSDHPRYRYDYADRTEIGLGLCCEAAAELILNRKEPMNLIAVEDDEIAEDADPLERDFFLWRSNIFQLAQNRALSVEDRVSEIIFLEQLPALPDPCNDISFLLSLERMDNAWAEKLAQLANPKPVLSDEWEMPLEQLLMYLLYRHLPASLEDGNRAGRLMFALYSWKLCTALLSQHPTMQDFCEIARLFSSEIEYSDENVGKIIQRLKKI